VAVMVFFSLASIDSGVSLPFTGVAASLFPDSFSSPASRRGSPRFGGLRSRLLDPEGQDVASYRSLIPL